MSAIKDNAPITLFANFEESELRFHEVTITTPDGPKKEKVLIYNRKGGLEFLFMDVEECKTLSATHHLTGPQQHNCLTKFLSGQAKTQWKKIIEPLNNNQLGMNAFDRNVKKLYKKLYGDTYGDDLLKYVISEAKKPRKMSCHEFQLRFETLKDYCEKVELQLEEMPSQAKWKKIYVNKFPGSWARDYLMHENSLHDPRDPAVTIESITDYMKTQKSLKDKRNYKVESSSEEAEGADSSDEDAPKTANKRSRSRSSKDGKKNKKQKRNGGNNNTNEKFSSPFKCPNHKTNNHKFSDCTLNPNSSNYRKVFGRGSGRGRGRGRGRGGYNNNWNNQQGNNQGQAQGQGRGRGRGQYSFNPSGQGSGRGNPATSTAGHNPQGGEAHSYHTSFNVPTSATSADNSGYPLDWGSSRLHRRGSH